MSSSSSSSRLDAHALLTSQGWRGTGHSLHPTSDATGLRHHLLIKREGTDGRGLGAGRAQHKADAWWLSAFDQALKGLDTNGAAGGLRQTVPGARLDLERITARGAAKYTGSRGLYTCFVRGGLLRGSAEVGEGGLLTPPESGAGTPEAASEISSGEEKKRMKKTKKEEKEKKEGKDKTKEERRARRAEKKQRKEKEAKEKAARKEAERKAEKKAQKKIQKKADKEAVKASETKEERRARREARRARKDEKRRKRKNSEG